VGILQQKFVDICGPETEIQLDESTDATNYAQLTTFDRHV